MKRNYFIEDGGYKIEVLLFTKVSNMTELGLMLEKDEVTKFIKINDFDIVGDCAKCYIDTKYPDWLVMDYYEGAYVKKGYCDSFMIEYRKLK